MKYWLSRDEKAAPEGPYPLQIIVTMRERKQIDGAAQVCREDRQHWISLDAAIAAELKPQKAEGSALEDAMAARDKKAAKSCSDAVSALCICMLIVSCIPGLGLVAGILFGGLFVLIGTILSIVQMVRGGAYSGIMNLIAVWVIVPVMGFILQGAAIAVAAKMGKEMERDEGRVLKEASYTPPPAKPVPVVKPVETLRVAPAPADSSKPRTAPAIVTYPTYTPGFAKMLESEREKAEKFITERGGFGIQMSAEQKPSGDVITAKFETKIHGNKELSFTFSQGGELVEVFSTTHGVIFKAGQ